MKTKSFSKQFACILLAAALLCFIGCPTNQEPVTDNGEKVEFEEGSSLQMAQYMNIGWNLGNTFDAHSSKEKTNEGLTSEISWLPDYDGDGSTTDNYTTQANIEGIKAAGFTTIRIPISWHNHMTDSSYTIDSSWMTRVKEVVDWAYNAGLYVIINVHHDNFATRNISSYYGYCVDSNYKTDSNAFLKAVWKQIATAFNNSYDEHLVFEVLNEPRCVGESCEWWVGPSTTPTATEANAIITEYEQTCLDAIRATGGNNAERFIMVPAYAGSSSCLDTYTLPTDTTTDKLILSFHAYSPYYFAMYETGHEDTTFDSADKSSLDSLFKSVYNQFSSIGIVIGETGATNKNNLTDRVNWTTYYFDKAHDYNMVPVFWDNGNYAGSTNSGEYYGYYDRSDNSWYFPSIMKAAMTAVGVNTSSCTINKSTHSPE